MIEPLPSACLVTDMHDTQTPTIFSHCRIWWITIALVAIEIFVLCDPTPGWRLGYVMRVVATCVIFFLACVGAFDTPRNNHDLLMCMLVAIAMHWETSILRWVTPEVQWWAGESSKMWLLFAALLQLNQGILIERIRRLQVWMISPTACIAGLLYAFANAHIGA